MAENDSNKLFSEFPPVSTEAWEEKIKADLKGADFDRKLVWNTLEGFKVQPFYRAENLENLQIENDLPGNYPYTRGKKVENKWEIRVDIECSDIDEANKKALDVLMKGATSIGFVVKPEHFKSQADFSRLMRGIHLDACEINFICGEHAPDFLAMLANETQTRKFDKQNIRGSVDFDVIGFLTMNGNCYNIEKHDGIEVAQSLIEFGENNLPNFKEIAVNGKHFHNCGASAVQELAFSLAVGSEYLHKLTEKGISINDIAPRIAFQFATGSNYFMEIAKFRAARMLWTKIVEAHKPCCNEICKMNLHAETSLWDKTIYDPYVNMLRITTETMSATIAGVDSFTVNPFDITYQKSNEFSERIARNTQIILKEESYFDKVTDPAAGSYYIEMLTDSVAQHAWQLFVEVEQKGGYIKSFVDGFIQSEIENMAAKRKINIATRGEILLGTNQFPNFNEKIISQIDCSYQLFDKQKYQPKDQMARPLVPFRAATDFEKLRLKTEKAAKRPKVFMLTFGNITMQKARATFACNFFACAGFEVIDNPSFKTIAEGANAAKAQNADIVVLCSSDEEYAEFAIPAYEILKNKAIFVVAGYPKACIKDLQKAGIENFIHIKSNVLETLQDFQEKLKIV